MHISYFVPRAKKAKSFAIFVQILTRILIFSKNPKSWQVNLDSKHLVLSLKINENQFLLIDLWLTCKNTVNLIARAVWK